MCSVIFFKLFFQRQKFSFTLNFSCRSVRYFAHIWFHTHQLEYTCTSLFSSSWSLQYTGLSFYIHIEALYKQYCFKLQKYFPIHIPFITEYVIQRLEDPIF